MFRLQLLKYRYLSIIKEEGLDISQPALDPESSEVHHHLTTRKNGSRIHRFNFFCKKVCFSICSNNNNNKRENFLLEALLLFF